MTNIPVTCVGFVDMKFKFVLLELLSRWEAGFFTTLEAKEDFLVVAGLVSQDVQLERLTAVEALDAMRTLECFGRISLTF